MQMYITLYAILVFNTSGHILSPPITMNAGQVVTEYPLRAPKESILRAVPYYMAFVIFSAKHIN